MRRRLVTLALLAAVLTGCASTPGAAAPSTPSTPSTPVPAAEGGPIDLVGLWRVSGAEGESVDTWLRLEAGELQLWRECGMINAGWQAGREAFIAAVFGASGDCADGSLPSVPWLESVTAYERRGDAWVLSDAGGVEVAQLSIDGAPEPIDSAADFYAEPPVIDDRVREYFAPAAELPAGLVPVDAEALVGRWVNEVATTAPEEPHVELRADGTYSASDGCNGASGRWTAGPGGEMLATFGAMTAIGCDGAGVPGMLAAARSAGFEGEKLVLLDAEGTRQGSLVRG